MTEYRHLSSWSEIVVAYALLTVGTNPNESLIMRERCRDAARELQQPLTADEIAASLSSVKA